MDLHDRRRHERYLAWIDAMVRDASGSTRPGVIVEVSASGALLQMGEEIPVGTQLAVFFPFEGEVIRVRCEVVRVLQGPGELLGVQFHADQREGTWNAIARLLAGFAGSTRPRGELFETWHTVAER
jgi:hypothetical protein